MLLITGATGFIGRHLMVRLAESGYEVRVLLRPSPRNPRIPHGVPMQAAVASLSDPRGLRAAMVGVDRVVHLATATRRGGEAELTRVDVEGTRNLCRAAADAGVEHLFFLSHLGADRFSAYPVFRAKADAEESVKASGVPYTILRTGPAFGVEDHLTVPLAMLLAVSPLIFLMPGDGATLLQPIWVEDLATCVSWGLDDPSMRGKVYEIGGPEFVSYRQLVQRVGQFAGYVRFLVPTRQPYLRAASRVMERFLPFPPLTTFNLDYLASNRTASLDALPSIFGLKPSRLEDKLDYLKGANWGWELAARQLRREFRGRR
jgi:uncharacterized protein YbjT (DUF2867 family)